MAEDIFAKIGDIKGESTDDKHKDEIEVLSYSWGVANTAPTGPGGAGKAVFQDVTIVHGIDKSTPSLFKACATGVHLKDATITHRKAGPARHEYLIVKLNDVLITSVSHSATADQQDFESVSLSFGKVHLEYRPQRPDGTPDTPVQFKFDLKANKAG